MAYWLMKSEPFKYSFEQLLKDKRTHWDGVRNYQAANNMKAMKKGDHAFFYHSNEGKEIVGVIEIVKTAYADPSDESGKFVMVDVAPVASMPKPVTLAQMKDTPALHTMTLFKQGRLSVTPVTTDEWKTICKMGGIKL
jgi:predicted RNA-binding protein with PUA-like domain